MKGSKPLKLQDLLTLYQANFIEEGYDSPSHKAARYEQGVADLTRYFQEYQKHLGKPLMLEQSFKLNLGGVQLVGKIDRIEQSPDGSLAIIDYKSGTPKGQKDVDRNEQLTLYALAAAQSLNLKPQKLGLYFLEPPSGLVATTRTDTQMEAAKVKIIEQIAELKASSFPPKPSDFACKSCPFNRLCPFAVR